MKKMKQHNIYTLFAFGAIACLLAACSLEEAVLDNPIEELQTYTLYLDADVPNFDAVRESETRASGNSWEDGDVIYVAYSNGGSKVVSNATYKSSLGAFEFSSVTLNAMSDASCSVYYFRGGTFSVTGNTVSMDKFTAIFTDTSAKYTCSGNTITLSAAFKPYTWRLCFKGLATTQVKLKAVSNIRYNTSLNLSTGSFSTKADSVNLLVQSDGYTPYVYGQFTGTSNTVQVKVGGTYYSRTHSSSKLAIGQSGYFTVPTTGNHANWSTSRDTSGFEYVDLGLPSGTLWAKCNVGAFSEEEYGDFYAWGETSGYNGLDRVFDWTTYKWCSGTSSSLTKYNSSDGLTQLELEDDAAYVNWGSPWRTPTREEWKELNDYTNKSNETINGINGRRLTSKNNSNSIFLPFGGYFNESTYIEGGLNANYWSSSLSSTKTKAYIAYTPNSGAIQYDLPLDRSATQAIRAVYDPSLEERHYPVADAIDLGLPSGTKWASWNIGASKPEEYGGYYAWGETEEKDQYDLSTYLYFDGSNETCQYIGDDIAGTEFDVAHVKWGGTWRMPSIDQIQELFDNCTRTWTTQNGVNGILVTGPNGATLFLPAAGCHWYSGLSNEGELSYYWSSSLYPRFDSNACSLYFSSNNWNWNFYDRGRGHSVRAVIPGETHVNPCPVAEAIDLGLPSGTKWASWNIGATKPEEYGGYYAWGETEEKDYYDWSTYIHCDGTEETCHYIGDDIAGTEYDVAHVKWGGTWRMPSIDQIQELVDNGTRSWTTLYGVNGILVTGPNGGSIFLPAAGHRWVDDLYSEGGYSSYWSSSLTLGSEGFAYGLSFGFDDWYCSYSGSGFGFSVRAVCL